MRRILLIVLGAFAGCLAFSFMNLQAGSHHAPSLGNDQSAVRGLYNARANQVTGKFSSMDLQQAMKEADDRISTRSVNLTWTSLGPDNIGGRTTAIAYDVNRPGWVYAGGVSGGMWKSTNSGNSWQPVSSVFWNTNISSLTQGPDGSIYAGTGEVLNGIAGGAPTGNSAFAFPGLGIYKLNVGDTNWNLIPSTIPSDYNSPKGDWNFVTSIVVNPTNASMIYAGTARGIQISTDGGATWTKATHSTSSQPFDTSIVYSLTIGNDGFVYANVANTYWRSSANGTDFTFQSGVNGFPSGNFGNIRFAVSNLNPKYVYAAVSDAAILTGNLFGIYQSKDDGNTWSVMVQGGSSTFEPLNGVGPNSTTIAVIPNDTTSLFMGGHDLFKYSNQFGWNQVSSQFFLNNYIPIGINIVVFNPANSGDILVGCDQGIYRSTNANAQYPNFFSVTRNYNVTQCYSADIGTNRFVLAGTEGTGAILNDTTGNTPQSFATLVGGSCGYVTIPRTNNISALVDLTQGGPSLLRFSNLTTGVAGGFFDIRIDADGNGVPDEGIDWLAPFDLYESSSGSSILAYGTNKALWVCPNPLNFSADANWFRLLLTPQNTDAAVTCVSFSNDGNSVFAGTRNGTVYRFDHVFDALVQGKYVYPSITSKSWNPDSNGITVSSTNILPGRYLRSIAVDPTNSNNIIVTAANYGNFSYVWRSTNALSVPMAFSDITGNLPKMPVWSAAIDQVNPNLVVLGTDLGLWAQDLSDGAGWQEANNGLPRVPVLQVRERSLNDRNYMFAASYGRGVFQSNDLGQTISGIDNSLHTNNNIKIFPDPVSAFANISITLQKNASVDIDVRNSKGDLIKHAENNFSRGEHSVQMNFQDVANGIYFISIAADGVVSSKKIIVVH